MDYCDIIIIQRDRLEPISLADGVHVGQSLRYDVVNQSYHNIYNS